MADPSQEPKPSPADDLEAGEAGLQQLVLIEQGGEQLQQQQENKEELEKPSSLIHCLCSDGEVVDMPANHLRQSKLFNGMCQNLQIVLDEPSEGATEEEENGKFNRNFPVPEIRSPIMRMVAEWCEKHVGKP